MQPKRCRVAFVGAGAMVREHARAFAGLDGVELAGITSRTRGRAEAVAAEAGIGRVYDSIDGMAREAGADLVVMAVYETAIRTTAEACLAHPWAMLMEKPIGLDLAEARAVAARAAGAGRRVWVGLNRRALGAICLGQSSRRRGAIAAFLCWRRGKNSWIPG